MEGLDHKNIIIFGATGLIGQCLTNILANTRAKLIIQGKTHQQVNELYNHQKVKAMISLTKGEGFGRPLQEFCLSKKPLIVSGWSGHMDFIEPGLSVVLGGQLEQVHPSAANQWIKKEYQWFQVNPKQAKDAMKNVFTNYKKYLGPAKQQGHYIKTEFSFDKMKELVGKILSDNLPEFATELKLNLPSMDTPSLSTPNLKKI